jgi:hypothetical protein
MDDPFSQLPKAAVLVYAGVLTAAASNTALAGQAELAAQVSTQEVPQTAPTCGPACHNPSYEEPVPREPEPDPVAPTCGPACHEGRNDAGNIGEPPPPLPPNEKKGCAVAEMGPQGELALLGLGLSFGVGLSIAGRRRRIRASEP